MSIEIVVALPGPYAFEVHHVSVSRVNGTTDPDSLNGYEVTLDDGQHDPRVATFEHRYGDGWLLCVARALTAIQEGGEAP